MEASDRFLGWQTFYRYSFSSPPLILCWISSSLSEEPYIPTKSVYIYPNSQPKTGGSPTSHLESSNTETKSPESIAENGNGGSKHKCIISSTTPSASMGGILWQLEVNCTANVRKYINSMSESSILRINVPTSLNNSFM